MQGIADTPVVLRPAQFRGVFGSVRALLFGAKQKEDTLGGADHGAWVRKVARAMALPLMFLFSFGALMQLAGTSIKADATIVAHKGVSGLDFVSVTTTFIVLAVILGMDVVMVKHALSWRDKRSLRKDWIECLDDTFYVLFIGGIEGLTYGMLLAAQENPQTRQQWLMVAMRAIAAPLVAIDLAMTGDRVPTKDEMKTSLAVEVGGAMKTIFQNIRLGTLGLKDLPVLYPLFGHLLGSYNAADKQSDDELIDRINAVMPGAVESMAQQEVEKARREADAAIDAAKRELDNVRFDYVRKVPAAIIAVLGGGEWPDWIVDDYPELAGMDMATAFKGRAKATAKAAPKTLSAGAQLEDIINELGIKAQPKPYPSSRDIWVKGDAMDILSGGLVNPNERTKLAKELSLKPDNSGDRYKYGIAYILPLRKLINELAERNKLISPLVTWLEGRAKGADSDTLSEDLAEAIPAL